MADLISRLGRRALMRRLGVSSSLSLVGWVSKLVSPGGVVRCAERLSRTLKTGAQQISDSVLSPDKFPSFHTLSLFFL